MQLIKQPNEWSCCACAFAMVCNLTLDGVILGIGHNGSEVLFPDLPEPLCRKGFPFPECIRLCLYRGLSVTPVDFEPECTPDGEHCFTLDHREYVYDMLDRYQGVIQGQGNKALHTVAWDRKQIYDSSIGIYDFENPYFTPERFWIVK